MGASQRAKGANGEREIANILKARGHEARRTAQMQSGFGGTKGDADVAGLPGVHLEIKRQERVSIEQWCRQAEGDAPAGNIPLVVWRRSRQPWRVTLSFDEFMDLYERANRS